MPKPAALLVLLTAIIAAVVLRGAIPPEPTARTSFGHGPTTIVLVHGLGSRASHWLPTARILAKHHRVVLVDLPGHGESEMPEPFTLDRAAQSLDLALAAESREPVVLVGHSLGGLVAAAEALDHPERVRGLVLIETALAPQGNAKERATMLASLDRDYDLILHDAYISFGRDSTQGNELWREVAALPPTMVKSWIRLALSTDLSRPIEGLRVPAIAVLAPRSWPLDESWAQTAAELGYQHAPRIEPTRLPGCGHFVMLDRPIQLAQLIESFAARLEPRPVAVRY